MPLFAQHTKLIAASDKRDELIAKFEEALEIQHNNPACEVMLVSVSPDASDIVYLTEVWSSQAEWENAINSDNIQAWAASMPSLVNGSPETERFEVVAGKGLGS